MALRIVRVRRLATALALAALAAAPAASALGQQRKQGESCLTCHFGIEDMHPWEPLSCTDCHGGDPKAETRELAHVKPKHPLPNDERVLPPDFDPDYLRFRNPSNLRVIGKTCQPCHQGMCADLVRSLHGTTAGHLSDGMYEAGLFESRGSRYGMFATTPLPDVPVSDRSLARLLALPSFDPKKPRDEFATHYLDLGPKNCVRCHLYSTGQALRGRLGFDGDYRSEGCAACHVLYADDGLAKGGDPTIDKFEPGHPLKHELTTKIPTSNCVHCHNGDASIGLSFRGLAQLYPGQPAGPEVQGTTDHQLNRAFYVDDPRQVPPDVHHERGMDCIDCHTVRDVMGDGSLYGQMPQAVEIECSDCHGTFAEPATGRTSRGNPIANLVKEAGRYFLVSKVSGVKHPVRQASQVVNPRHPDFNPRAAEAMKPEHERLECYACHGAWSPNFFGFHFDRQEQFTQLDMMSGERTKGRVNTQEKVFATLRGLYLGWNEDDRIAPYMVGFSSMGSVTGEDGEVLIDQEMPVTKAGLSGMTLIHHQLHTTRPNARECADCHRNPTALGLGSPDADFKLGRDFAFLASARGLDVLSIDRKQPGDSLALSSLPMLGVVDVALEIEPLQGHAIRAYLAAKGRGVAVVDLANPAFPRQVAFLPLPDPRALTFAAGRLYVAGGTGGLVIADVADPAHPSVAGTLASADARDVALNWPHAYVADHVEGLIVADVTKADAPRRVTTFDLNAEDDEPNQAVKVALLLEPSRPAEPKGEGGQRSHLHVLAGVACLEQGFRCVDVTEPSQPVPLIGFGFLGGGRRGEQQNNVVTGVAAGMHVDLGSPDGAIPTAENDYFYVTVAAGTRQQGRLVVVNASNPFDPKAVGSARTSEFCDGVSLMHLFNPPFLQTYALVSSGDLLEFIDVTKSSDPKGVGQFGGLRGAKACEVESMALDRLIDENGTAWKDISHAGSRFFSRAEVDKILRVQVPVARGGRGPATGGRGARSERPGK